MNGEAARRAADYEPTYVVAAESVVIELWQILGAYCDVMVLVGGSVPPLLVPDARPRHTGSIDVDVLLDPEVLTGVQYEAVLRLIDWVPGPTQT